MNKHLNSGTLQVHIAVLLFGMTGLFGKFLNHSPFVIVLGRVFFSSIYIGIWMLLKKESFKLKVKGDYVKLTLMGALLSGHWVTFYASIQMSNVAVGLLTFSTFPVFVSLFRPIIFKTKHRLLEIILGLVTLIGIGFVVPINDVFSSTMAGAMLGVLSGGIYALFTIFNEHMVKDYPGRIVSFYEQLSATILLSPSLLILHPVFSLTDIGLLIILGTIFTGLGHTLFITGLKQVSAYMASMITMLEPLYSIALAYLILGERVSYRVYIGGAIILGAVLYLSLQSYKEKERIVVN